MQPALRHWKMLNLAHQKNGIRRILSYLSEWQTLKHWLGLARPGGSDGVEGTAPRQVGTWLLRRSHSCSSPLTQPSHSKKLIPRYTGQNRTAHALTPKSKSPKPCKSHRQECLNKLHHIHRAPRSWGKKPVELLGADSGHLQKITGKTRCRTRVYGKLSTFRFNSQTMEGYTAD